MMTKSIILSIAYNNSLAIDSITKIFSEKCRNVRYRLISWPHHQWKSRFSTSYSISFIFPMSRGHKLVTSPLFHNVQNTTTTICAAICFVPPITRLLGPHVGHMNLAIRVRLRKIHVFGLEISDNQNNWKDFVGKLLGKIFVVVFYFRVYHPINLFCTPSTARHYESYTAAPDIANGQDFLMPWLTKHIKPQRRASEWCT